jgi:hypothetical protein
MVGMRALVKGVLSCPSKVLLFVHFEERCHFISGSLHKARVVPLRIHPRNILPFPATVFPESEALAFGTLALGALILRG